MMDIRVNKESEVSLREQIATQVEFLIATQKLKPGEMLRSLKELARISHRFPETGLAGARDEIFMVLGRHRLSVGPS